MQGPEQVAEGTAQVVVVAGAERAVEGVRMPLQIFRPNLHLARAAVTAIVGRRGAGKTFMALDMARHTYAACAGDGDPVTSTVVITAWPQPYAGMQCTVMHTLDMTWLDALVADRIRQQPQQRMLLILDDCIWRSHWYAGDTIISLFEHAGTARIHVICTFADARHMPRRSRALVNVIAFMHIRDARFLHQDFFPGVNPVALSEYPFSRYESVATVVGSGEAYRYTARTATDAVNNGGIAVPDDGGGIAIPADDAPSLPP